jgi:parallel beta-helix repeat protein
VAGNLIGIGADGSTQLGNQSNGVRIGGSNNTVGPNNLIAFNQQSGVLLLGSNTTVLSNTIESNGRSGICVTAPNTTVDRNLIQGNGTGQGPWPECSIQGGVVITDTDNSLITSNRIFSNANTGITVYGGVSNRILSNSISDNGATGIRLLSGGNEEVPPPQIQSVKATSVSGSACPACRVEIFTDSQDEGRYFIGTAIASSSGTFSFAPAPGSLQAPHITATHTDSQGNTSAFAPAVAIPPPADGTPIPTPPTPTVPPQPAGQPTRSFLPLLNK